MLDEHLPITLRIWMPRVEAFTVAYRGWKGLTNGALLAAATGQIDVLVTFDAAMQIEEPRWRAVCGLVLLTGRNEKPSLRAAASRIEGACIAVERGASLLVRV